MIINNKILRTFKMHLQIPLFYNSILLFILFHYLTYIIYKYLKMNIFYITRKTTLYFFLSIFLKIISYEVHPYNTYTKDSLHCEIFRSVLGQRSAKYKGSICCETLKN